MVTNGVGTTAVTMPGARKSINKYQPQIVKRGGRARHIEPGIDIED
jgi:hypothetical protein